MNWSMMRLRAIGEIAELRFPQHQGLRVGERIAIFEAEHAEFGQAGCRAPRSGRRSTVAQRDIFVAGLLIDPDRMALAEGAAAAILARQANAMALGEQAAERQRFGGRPVEALAAFEHRLLGIEDALQSLVDVEAFGDRRQNLAELLQLLVADRSRDVAAAEHRLVGPAEAGPAAFEPVGLVGQVGGRRPRTPPRDAR